MGSSTAGYVTWSTVLKGGPQRNTFTLTFTATHVSTEGRLDGHRATKVRRWTPASTGMNLKGMMLRPRRAHSIMSPTPVRAWGHQTHRERESVVGPELGGR